MILYRLKQFWIHHLLTQNLTIDVLGGTFLGQVFCRHFILHELRSTYNNRYWPKRYKAKLVLRLKLLGWKVKYNSLLTIDLLSKKGIKLIKRIEFVTRRMTTLYTYLKSVHLQWLFCFCFLGIHIEKWRANSPLSLLSILKIAGNISILLPTIWSDLYDYLWVLLVFSKSMMLSWLECFFCSIHSSCRRPNPMIYSFTNKI